MIDALMTSRPIWEERARIIGPRLGLVPGRPYAVLTLHRSLNVDDPPRLAGLVDGVQALVRHLPVVFPVHPRVWPRLAGHDLVLPDEESPRPSGENGLICLETLAHLEFIALVSRARVVLTDCGGIQDETTMKEDLVELPVCPSGCGDLALTPRRSDNAWTALGFLHSQRMKVCFGLLGYYLLAIHLAFLVGFVPFVSGRHRTGWQRVGS